jgi:hypothetical protein
MRPPVHGAGRLYVAGVFALVAGCQESTPPRAISSAPSNPAALAEDATPSQLAVAQAVPGFGGYFIDDSGSPTVYLTDATQRDAAAQALAAFLDSFGWTAADLRVREATYDYLQLDAWYRAVRGGALAVAGAVFGDIDEANNRLTFAALDRNALASIASTLAQAGVPDAAVNLKVSGPVAQVATLRDRMRPPVGGVQINFFPLPASPVTLLCTLGFNVVKGADTSFITNSHCSNVQGGTTTPTDYYQATRGGVLADAMNFIAREVEDPDYVMGGLSGPCPIGRRCRTADVSRARYAPGQGFQIGRIARPLHENASGTLADTITIDSLRPYFTIVGEQGTSIVGQKLAHTGRTTGWTSGLVTETCVDISVTDSDITQLCQDLVDAYVAGGDSGSPVFGEYTDGSVFLAGILWGSSTDLETGHVQFIMSPMRSIRAEIGDIKTFDPPVVSKKHGKKAK